MIGVGGSSLTSDEKGLIIWICGATSADEVQSAKSQLNTLAEQHRFEVLDADAIRHHLSLNDRASEQGVSEGGVAWVARLLAKRGIASAVLASASPEALHDARSQAVAEALPFVELVLDGAESAQRLGQRVAALIDAYGTEGAQTRGSAPEADATSQDASVVVVRDRDPAALQDPPRRTFGAVGAVTYRHAAAPGRLPPSRHYVFNLERLDDLNRRRAARLRAQGTDVTVIVRQLDAATAKDLANSSWNVIPAYGDAEHIGHGTLRRAVRMACDGQRVVARGFLGNSGPDSAHRPARHRSTFLDLVRQMSDEARAGEKVVAAVLAPQRTGSQWLRDLIGWTAGADVRVFHEHGIPETEDDWPDSSSLADALAHEPDRNRQTWMRRAALRSVLLSARRRYVFLTDRDPADRVISFFVRRRSISLRERLIVSEGTFEGLDEIQREFDAWAMAQVAHHTRWFRSTFVEPFGLHVERAQATHDGLLVTHHGPNTLVIVPTERLDALRLAVEAEYGEDVCAPLADNSAAARGDAEVMTAFRRHVRVPPAIERALRDIPEVAHVRSAVSAERRSVMADVGAGAEWRAEESTGHQSRTDAGDRTERGRTESETAPPA